MTSKGYDQYGEGKGSNPESFERILSFTCTTKDNRPYVEIRGWKPHPDMPNSAFAIFDARDDDILPMIFAMILRMMEKLPMVYSNNPEDFDRVQPEGEKKPDLKDILSRLQDTMTNLRETRGENGVFGSEGDKDTPQGR